MNKLLATLLGVIIVSADLTPAFALGGCGPNRHRSSVTGRCIWGGQNQADTHKSKTSAAKCGYAVEWAQKGQRPNWWGMSRAYSCN
jgi:hypothetical protein